MMFESINPEIAEAIEETVSELDNDEAACLLRTLVHYFRTGEVGDIRLPEKAVFLAIRMALSTDKSEKEG